MGRATPGPQLIPPWTTRGLRPLPPPPQLPICRQRLPCSNTTKCNTHKTGRPLMALPINSSNLFNPALRLLAQNTLPMVITTEDSKEHTTATEQVRYCQNISKTSNWEPQQGGLFNTVNIGFCDYGQSGQSGFSDQKRRDGPFLVLHNDLVFSDL